MNNYLNKAHFIVNYTLKLSIVLLTLGSIFQSSSQFCSSKEVNVPLVIFQETFFTFEFFTASVCLIRNALLWFVSVWGGGGGDVYVIYYECMDTACLFIDDSCVYARVFSFPRAPACLCAHIKTVIWSVHVSGVERRRGGRAFDLRLVCTLCSGMSACASAFSSDGCKCKLYLTKSGGQIPFPTCELSADISRSVQQV